MPDWLSIHEPILVNTIGHCGGAVIFGMLLYFFLVNWRRGREERAKLPVVAAALAFLWNIGSLIALGTGPRGGMAPDIIVAASFSVLSLLPAVLLPVPALLWPLLFLWGGTLYAFYSQGVALLGEAFAVEELAAANTVFVMVYCLGGVIGPTLGGLAMDAWMPRGLLLFLAAAPLLLLAGLLARRPTT